MALNQHQHPGGYGRIGFRSPQLDVVDPTIPFLPLEDPAAASQNATIRFRAASMVATVAVAIGMSAFAAHAFNATPANIIPVRQAALVKELPTVPVQPQYGKVVPFVSGTSAFIRTRYGTPTPGSQVGFRTSAFSDYVFNATPANIIPVRQAVQVQPDPLRPIPPTYGRVVPFVAGTQAFIQTRSGVWTPTERVGLRTPAFGDYAFNATPAPVIPFRTRPLSELTEPVRLVLPQYGQVIAAAIAPANPVIPIRTRPLAELRDTRFITTPAFSSPNVNEAVSTASPPIPIRQQNPSLGVPGRLINSIYWNETLYYHYRPHLPIQVRRLEELRVEPRLVLPQVLPFPYWTPPPPANPVIPIQSRRLSELELPAPLIVVGYYGLVIHNDEVVIPPATINYQGDGKKRKKRKHDLYDLFADIEHTVRTTLAGPVVVESAAMGVHATHEPIHDLGPSLTELVALAKGHTDLQQRASRLQAELDAYVRAQRDAEEDDDDMWMMS